MPQQGKTHDRGYGRQHQKLRELLLPAAYGTPCWRCGELMLPDQDLDLGHREDRNGYAGMEHAKCNRGAGGRKGGRNRVKRDVTIRVDNP